MGKDVTTMGRERKESKQELKKHAATIHCSNSLSLLQRKITNALLYHAYQELMLKNEHEITVKQLCRLIGYKGNNHAAIKEALKGLITTVIEWNLIDDETGLENWTASSMIASVSLEGPLCYYAYSPRMKQLLHSPSMFGKIDLVIQSQFRSSYGLALYENCTRYRGLPHTRWLDTNLFRKLMGVPPDKYEIFRDFKRRVLDKSVDEVNTYSDLVISPEFIREGRKVVRIRFKLKERAKKARLGNRPPLATFTSPLIEKLLHTFQLSSAQADQLLKEYDSNYIMEKITIIEASKPFQEGKIQSLAAYLLSAVKHDYQSSKPASELKLIQDNQYEFEIAQLKRRIEDIRSEYGAYREKIIYEAIQILAPDTRQQFMQGFRRYAQQAIDTILQVQRSKYTPDNVLESPQIQALLRQYALRELDLFSIISIEEFVSQQSQDKMDAWQKLKSYDPDHSLLRFSE
ncbi:MAG TPA: replication initiation protein [Gammaproteobacteria bacterium]|nr:replication initiation protein [Gammaproteobacteria bacterium]